MKAHKAIEGITDFRRRGKFDESALDFFEQKIIESQKFDFDFGEFPVLSEDELQRQVRNLNLPYPLCYFSVPSVGAVLARDHADSVLIQVFIQHEGRVGMLPPSMPLVLDKRDGSICCMSEDPEVQKEWHDPSDKGVLVCVGLICLVVRGLSVLNCSNVTVIDNPPPAALNKKRAKSGKGPLFTYKTLHINTSKAQVLSGASSLTERNATRLHLRRGHIRRLPTGTTTWVQSCMVGSTSNGMVMKDYRVTA